MANDRRPVGNCPQSFHEANDEMHDHPTYYPVIFSFKDCYTHANFTIFFAVIGFMISGHNEISLLNILKCYQ